MIGMVVGGGGHDTTISTRDELSSLQPHPALPSTTAPAQRIFQTSTSSDQAPSTVQTPTLPAHRRLQGASRTMSGSLRGLTAHDRHLLQASVYDPGAVRAREQEARRLALAKTDFDLLKEAHRCVSCLSCSHAGSLSTRADARAAAAAAAAVGRPPASSGTTTTTTSAASQGRRPKPGPARPSLLAARTARTPTPSPGGTRRACSRSSRSSTSSGTSLAGCVASRRSVPLLARALARSRGLTHVLLVADLADRAPLADAGRGGRRRRRGDVWLAPVRVPRARPGPPAAGAQHRPSRLPSTPRRFTNASR